MAYQDKREEKKAKKTSLEEGKECPNCEATNELEAKFCGECGYDFVVVKRCPKCGAKVLPNADICEVCGEWLLEGQCKFCYAILEPEANFCGECGNPAEGIECPHCHNLSYFDFCKDCNIPLTKQAQETIDAIKNSEEFRSLLEVSKQGEPVQSTPSEKEELEKMRQYRERIEHREPKRKIFSLSDKDTSKIDKIVQKAQDKKARQEQQKPDADGQIQQKKFADNQEARRFYGALKILLPKRERKQLGWRCNAYNCVHPDGPHQCADPSSGGEWLFDEQTKFQEVEI